MNDTPRQQLSLKSLWKSVLGGRRPADDERFDADIPDVDDANPDTLDLIFEHTKDSASDQLRDSEQLDTKTTAVFAAATLALGFAARLPQAEVSRLRFVLGTMSGDPVTLFVSVVSLCIYLAALFWVIVAIVTLHTLRTRPFWRSLQADDLWPRFAKHQPDQFKRVLIRDAVRAYGYNREVLKLKSRLLNLILLMTGLEGLFIVAALVLSR